MLLKPYTALSLPTDVSGSWEHGPPTVGFPVTRGVLPRNVSYTISTLTPKHHFYYAYSPIQYATYQTFTYETVFILDFNLKEISNNTESEIGIYVRQNFYLGDGSPGFYAYIGHLTANNTSISLNTWRSEHFVTTHDWMEYKVTEPIFRRNIGIKLRYVRLIRVSSYYYFYISSDGINWLYVGYYLRAVAPPYLYDFVGKLCPVGSLADDLGFVIYPISSIAVPTTIAASFNSIELVSHG